MGLREYVTQIQSWLCISFITCIRYDDSAKVKLNKINALTHQLNNSCKKFLKLAKEREEGPDIICMIEANRNMAARELY